MRGISFAYTRPVAPPDPNRMDIACFIGLVPQRSRPAAPPELVDWWRRYGWLERVTGEHDPLRIEAIVRAGGAFSLTDVPVPVESWDEFCALFAANGRLDGRVELRGAPLPATVTIGSEETVFRVMVDGREQDIILPEGGASPDALAAHVASSLRGATVRVEIHDGRQRLVVSRLADGRSGRLTVAPHGPLGFPMAESVSGETLECYLAAAVRSFFTQGGRMCYVVSMGDPLPLAAGQTERIARLGRLLFADDDLWVGVTTLGALTDAWLPPLVTPGEPHDQWHGIEHLLGLPEVTFVTLPDLPDLLAAPPRKASPLGLKLPPELFTDCTPATAELRSSVATLWDVPRCDEEGYRVWGRILGTVLEFVRSSAREVQLLASLPIPHETFEKGLTAYLERELLATGSGNGIASSFLQIVYPWLVTSGSGRLPGGAEPPEGALAGILAITALTRGAFASAAGTLVQGASAFVPATFESHCGREDEDTVLPAGGAATLCERVSLFDQVPRGMQLITDVTASIDPSYRPAPVNRLVATVVRAARTQGTATVFEPNSEMTWRAVERGLGAILTALYEEGGLTGANAAEAFAVTCDMSTMTRNDLDNGRLIAQVTVQPSVPVERISIALTLADGGRLALRGGA